MNMDDMRLMRREEVIMLCGFSRSTMYNLIGQGQFPGPVRIGARSVAWRKSEVVAWLAERPPASEASDL